MLISVPFTRPLNLSGLLPVMLALFLATALFPAAVAGVPTLKTPFTYAIDYGCEYVRSATFSEVWGDPPPTMFHAGNTPRTLGPA
jgi:hypothetical protein